MQIVPFESADFKFCAGILASCIKDPERELSEYLENGAVKVFCAKDGEDIVGALCVLESLDMTDILDVAVSPDKRRRGVGRGLLEFAAQKYPVLMLEVRESNAPARALYEKCGFEQIAVRKNYYSAPVENAIIYRREQK